ncbi:MAG: DUF11 domain-containing protein [Candidatus Kerfeldbacteria bacterium]|nr:DUF11 domain-containing protein [Candidatus Kerfeldbacteria bacterium]
MYHSWLRKIILGLSFMGMLFLCSASSTFAATWTVNSPEDSSDGSCTMPYTNVSNDCTLREAVAAANATSDADTITFSIDSSFTSNASYYADGQYTITLASAVTTISGPTTISAASSWDSTHDRPGIRLYSSSTSFNALTFGSGATNSRVSALELAGFNTAITASGTGMTIGTNCDGVDDSAERNILHSGIVGIAANSAQFHITGNIIGLDDDGDTYRGYSKQSINITGAATDNGIIGFHEGSTGSCSAATQRNIIAGSTGSFATIAVTGTGTAKLAGDTALGPDHISIAGNYIGVDVTGTKNRSGKQNSGTGSGSGVVVSNNATLNWIGTDGDGLDDEQEQNVIVSASVGVSLNNGNNRAAGNYIGVNAIGNTTMGNTMLVGIILRGVSSIAGWCDTSIHAALCFDGGSETNQRNVVGGATLEGIRFGVDADSSLIYGNYIGVGADGTSDIGNTTVGAFVHRASKNNRIGGTGSRANVIKFNGIGIQLNGSYTGTPTTRASQTPMTNITIAENTVTNNDTIGIQAYWTENYDTTVGVDSITINNNTVEDNGTIGIDVWGSSPTIDGNTIRDNGSYGMSIHPAFIAYNTYTEAVESYSPADAATNLGAFPIVTNNTLARNGAEAIYQLDASAENSNTLYRDNTFGDTNGFSAIAQTWYGALEILDRDGNPIPTATWTSTTGILTPEDTALLDTARETSAANDVNGSDMVFGPSGISYTDVRTWLVMTAYTVSGDGTQTDFNTYTVRSDGTYAAGAAHATTYTFDGLDNETAYADVLPNGIQTDGVYRFQIAKVRASTIPETPMNNTPNDGSIDLPPASVTLQTSIFNDAEETHQSSIWQIFSTVEACDTNGTADIFDITSSSALTNLTLSADVLTEETTYFWHVAYINSYDNVSNFSPCTSLTTLRTTPALSSAIPDQQWNEDEQLNNAVDLDDYFTDAEGETLTYTAVVTDMEHMNVRIDTETHIVSFTATEHWFGTGSVIFTACDTDGQCESSNNIQLTVNTVNDIPGAPMGGFLPTNETTVTTFTPTLSWNDGSDIEDTGANLQYEIHISTQPNPQTDTSSSVLFSALGASTITLSEKLLNNTTYYYAVRTIDSNGAVSDWSLIGSFVTNVVTVPTITLSKTIEVIDSDSGEMYTIARIYDLTPPCRLITATMTTNDVHPGDTLRFTLQFNNIGNILATSAVITDNIPADTDFVIGSSTRTENGISTAFNDATTVDGTSLSFAVGAVAAGTSQSISYDVALRNPLANTSIDSAAALFTATEIDDGSQVVSNTTSVPVTSGTVRLQVKTSAGVGMQNTTLRLYIDNVNVDNEILTTATDADGVAIVNGLRAGTYWVEALVDKTRYTIPEPQLIILTYNATTTSTLTIADEQKKSESDDVVEDTKPDNTDDSTSNADEQEENDTPKDTSDENETTEPDDGEASVDEADDTTNDQAVEQAVIPEQINSATTHNYYITDKAYLGANNTETTTETTVSAPTSGQIIDETNATTKQSPITNEEVTGSNSQPKKRRVAIVLIIMTSALLLLLNRKKLFKHGDR